MEEELKSSEHSFRPWIFASLVAELHDTWMHGLIHIQRQSCTISMLCPYGTWNSGGYGGGSRREDGRNRNAYRPMVAAEDIGLGSRDECGILEFEYLPTWARPLLAAVHFLF